MPYAAREINIQDWVIFGKVRHKWPNRTKQSLLGDRCVYSFMRYKTGHTKKLGWNKAVLSLLEVFKLTTYQLYPPNLVQ